MKKNVLLAGAASLFMTNVSAQLNVQLHYDLGYAAYRSELASRQRMTATVENFSADT